MPLALFLTVGAWWAPAPAQETSAKVLVVVGHAGEPQFGAMFAAWAEKWRQAAASAGAEFQILGKEAGEDEGEETTDRQRLHEALAAEPRSGDAPLWLVLIGHGVYDGKTAKFNLVGPDFSAAELAEWLSPIERPTAVINCASSSGPFINALSRPGRVVITATRSGDERNFARFGEYLAASIADPAADLDKDQETSLLEAFLRASAETARFYRERGRLATEHSLIDDNGDGKGTPADWFQGVRVVKAAADNSLPDGPIANQWRLGPSSAESLAADARQRRDALEQQIEKLRLEKAKLDEDDYYARLERLAIELARLYAHESDMPPK